MSDATDESRCPHCGADLTDVRDDWSGYRTILVEIRGVYDGGLFWMCPDCEGRWHRWPVGHYLRARAERYIQVEE
jgi:uncharacterized protein with PIN domain